MIIRAEAHLLVKETVCVSAEAEPTKAAMARREAAKEICIV